MMGAIVGDLVGSRFEFADIKFDDPYGFELFGESKPPEPASETRSLKSIKQVGRNKCQTTDDTVLTCAVIETLLGRGSYEENFVKFGKAWPAKGYGGKFAKWVNDPERKPYNSFGNGSSMRVSSIGWAFDTIEETRAEAVKSALPTHNHPEGIKGAESTAVAVFLARTGKTKDEIRDYITREFGYDLTRSVEKIRETSKFDVSCQGTCPEAFTCFLESNDYEHAIRNFVSFGADADTGAAIAGSIAEAFYGGVPDEILTKALPLIEPEFQATVVEFGKWVKERHEKK